MGFPSARFFRRVHLHLAMTFFPMKPTDAPLGEPNHGNSTKRVSQPQASGLAYNQLTQVTGESQEIVTKVGDFEDQGAVCGVLKTDQWHPMAI